MNYRSFESEQARRPNPTQHLHSMPGSLPALSGHVPQAPPVGLREIDINVTNRCNLECIYCSYSSRPSSKEPELSAERIHRLLDEAAGMGTGVIHFSGGEPAIRPDMPEFIAHGAALGFKMRMHSNGAPLTESKLEQLWSAGLRQVLISLDGFEKDHDFHRAKPGLYQKTTRAIRTAAGMGFNVRVNSVATRLNVDAIPNLLPMIAEMGAATFSVFYVIPVGRGRSQAGLMVPPERWREFLGELQSIAARRGTPHLEVTAEKVFLWENEWTEEEEPGAGRGGTCLGFLNHCNYVLVLADGRVYPCVCFIDEAPPLGNIYETPLREILEDARSWSFYRNLAEPNPTCRACDLFGMCRGGNKALSRIERRDWNALDPRCSGDPRGQGFLPLCFMARENIQTRSRSGFAEHLPHEA